MGPIKNQRKKNLRLFVIAAVVLVSGSGVQLSRLWFKRERISFLLDWDSSCPISANLSDCLCFEWGGTFSIVEDGEPGEAGYIGITYRQWRIGPFMVRRVIYQRPGSHYD